MSSFHILFKNQDSFKEFFIKDEDKSLSHLPDSKNINIFIGTNNSGKSRFLRRIMANKEFLFVKSDKIEDYRELVIDYNKAHNSGFDNTQIQMIPMLFSSIKQINDGNKYTIQHTRNGFKNLYIRQIEEINLSLFNDVKCKRYYIPTLRTAHTLFDGTTSKIETDIYLQTLSNNYSIHQYEIKTFTGIHLHREILNARNAKKDVRKSFEAFEKFISKNFFNGKDVDIVAEFNKDENLKGNNHNEITSVHIDGEKDRYLYELGDGIQAIIILMYQIFMAEPDSMIFIDEPELHLHPGMQRLFLEQLCTNEDLKKKNLTYFITTHSNHFLDLTIEKDNVSIYSFTSELQENGEKKFIIKNVNAGDNEILQNLGVNNSSVFMANCSIWVEGISDRNYIKAFLKAYSEHLFKDENKEFKSIKEDIDYAFFEYAGSNIEHYFFDELDEDLEDEVLKGINAMALNNRILLLADSDNVKEGRKFERLEKLKAAKKDNFVPVIIEQVREIENLLTNDIWNRVLIKFCNKKLLSKHENEIEKKISSVLEGINAMNYQTEYVGEFLNKINRKLKDIGGINILNESIYEHKTKAKFGTFILKRELSELVLKADFSWEVFEKNPRIVQLTKSVYNFITKRME
jgi:predicted ATP-dependent endonuclease of OLD family